MRQMLQKAVEIHFGVNYKEICSPKLKEDEDMKDKVEDKIEIQTENHFTQKDLDQHMVKLINYS